MREGRVLQLLGPSAGGIRRHVAALATLLPTMGWDVRTAGPAGVLDDLAVLDEIVAVSTDPRDVLAGRRALQRVLDLTTPDVVHADGLKAGWLATSLGRRPPVVVTVHNAVLDESAGRLAPALRMLERALPRRADVTIAVSAELGAAVPAVDVHVIAAAALPPAPRRSAEEVRATLGAGGRPLVVCVARLHPQKGHDALLTAVPAIVARVPDVLVVLVGDGPLRDALSTRVESDPMLRAHVVLAGASPNAADEMAAADVVVLASIWEGSPITVVEALLLERPLVATAVGTIPELVVDGVTGRLVRAGQPMALAAAVADLLEAPEEADRLGAAGAEAARDQFGATDLVGAVAAVYDAVRA